MPAHRIRLAGPWEWSLQRDGSAADRTTSWARCQLPYRAEAETSGHTIRLRRKFHQPTGLDNTLRVFVVLESTLTSMDEKHSNIRVFLNDAEVSCSATESVCHPLSVKPWPMLPASAASSTETNPTLAASATELARRAGETFTRIAKFEVTVLLTAFNTLEIVLPASHDNANTLVLSSVAIEIVEA